MMESARPGPRILLTGATGYVGGRLLKSLETGRHSLRCLARSPEHLRHRVAPSTEIVEGDARDLDAVRQALGGIDVAFYLMHALGVGSGWQQIETQTAETFSRAAAEEGIGRIIYLGGLGAKQGLSDHLATRHRVGEILRASGVPTIEFRASIIIGSGSLSFEMIRALVDRLPIMTVPKWVRVRAQPIAIEDVIEYLKRAVEIEVDSSDVFEIGGADQVSYADIMAEYARQRGLKRVMIPVPVLSPWLSSLWLGLVTPLFARVGKKLILGVSNETIVRDNRATEIFDIRPRGTAEAIARALVNEDHEFSQTRWSDAISAHGEMRRWGGVRFGSRLVDSYAISVSAPPDTAFAAIERIGGETGWYYGDWLLRLRGFLDLLVGGVGMRRGRRDPTVLVPGDVVDFLRVEAVEPNRLLRFQAEMRLPGRAWLQFEVEPAGEGSTLRLTALMDPVGLSGLLYWYSVHPFHRLLYTRILRAIARMAEERSPTRRLQRQDTRQP